MANTRERSLEPRGLRAQSLLQWGLCGYKLVPSGRRASGCLAFSLGVSQGSLPSLLQLRGVSDAGTHVRVGGSSQAAAGLKCLCFLLETGSHVAQASLELTSSQG